MLPAVPEALRQVLRSYLRYISQQFQPEDARKRFLSFVPGDTNVVCLEETARMYRELGETDEAKSWYYRAYRADYLNGGLPYAEFLASVVTTASARKCCSISSQMSGNPLISAEVAAAVTENNAALQRMRRLTRRLIRRLEERRQTLSSNDRECLAAAYRCEAADALSRDDYAACM